MDRSLPDEDPARRSAGRSRLSIAIVAAIVIVLVLVLMLYLGSAAVGRYEDYLSGLWVGDSGFLEKAQLRDIQLFLAPREGKSRQGYLIMTDLSGNFVSNQAIEVKVGSSAQRWWTALKSVFRFGKDAYRARNVEIEYDGGGEGPMPRQLKMSLSMADGTLTLYDEEKVYAFLEKDLMSSAYAVEAYKS